MKKTDLAWAAGIIEGEGSAAIYRIKRPKKDIWEKRPVIKVGNTDIEMLEELQRILGGWVGLDRPAGYQSGTGIHTVDYYVWMTQNRGALRVAEQILPYLRTRKKRAILQIIQYYKDRPT